MREFPRRLSLIPPPAENITPEVARQWLREKFASYTMVSFAGFQSEDAEIRDACHFLAADLMELVETAFEAIDRGESVPIRWDPEEVEGPLDHRARLACLVSGEREQRHSDGPFQDAYDELAGQLVDLLRKDAERASAARKVA